MPRKSSQALAVLPPLNVGRTRIKPPSDLGASEAKLFSEIVSSLDARHFAVSDAQLLGRYCEALLMAERAAKELREHGPVTPDGKLNLWAIVQEKQLRAVASLAGKLRLCPQSRMDSRAAQRRAEVPVGPRPWQTD